MWISWESWLSLETASRIGDIANVIFILSLVAGVVSTMAIVGTTSVKEWYWDKDRRESSERIEELKHANLKLEAKIAPRRLSGEDIRKMTEILSKAPKSGLGVVSRVLDPEGSDFADDIISALKAAHWEIAKFPSWTRSDRGVFIATAEGTSPGPEIGPLIEALDAVNIEHKTIVVSGEDLHRVSPWLQQGVLYLMIGAKP